MKYIVKNCPNCNHTDWDNGYGELEEGYLCNVKVDDFECKDCDCIIKQIITICKGYKMSKEDMKKSKEFADIIRGSKYGSDALAIQILQLFDIEEINK